MIVAFIGPLRPDSPDNGGPEFFDHVEEFARGACDFLRALATVLACCRAGSRRTIPRRPAVVGASASSSAAVTLSTPAEQQLGIA